MTTIQYPIKLKHNDLLPGSEIITVPGGQFDALVRDQDYIIDYKNGIITIIITGVVASLPRINNAINLDISYRRKVNFEEEFTLESHIEVFNEVAKISDVFQLQVTHEPVLDVFRVFNRTTGEAYTITSFLNKTIFISGTNAPRNINLEKQEALLDTRELINNQFNNVIKLILPNNLQPAKEHPIVSIDSIQANTLFRFLIKGGVDIPQDTYALQITSNIVNIEMLTGSTILRRSNRQLISGTDYVSTIDVNAMTMTITLTDVGKTAIGNNSVFFRFNKIYSVHNNEVFEGNDITESEHHLTLIENFISEVTSFNASGVAQLSKFTPFIKKAQEVDELIFPPLIVTNQAGSIIFVEGRDYVVDKTFRRLIRIDTSSILSPFQVVKVIYADEESFTFTGTITQDVVLVDYDYGSNAVNWTPSFTSYAFEEVHNIVKDTRFLTLQKFPTNSDVTIFRSLDNQRTQYINVIDVDLMSKRIQFEPLPETGSYHIQYTAHSEVIDRGANYFISYRYGARKRALIDNYAALLNITTGTVIRNEIFDFINGQDKIVLSNAPSDYTRSVIYLTGDPDKTPLSTPISFETATGTLFFTNIISAGNYTVEYPVLGFQTEQLRTAIIALLQSFILGPTKNSLIQLIKSLTGLEPDVIESVLNGFTLTNDSNSDFLNPLSPIVSPNLSDGQSSIEFAPSRFANGLSLKASNNAWVAYSALNNLRIDEGSLSFLLGTFWDGDDERSHQLFDMIGTNEFTNRMTLYKNQRGLLAFEIHDKNSKLFRVTTDITRIVRNEIIHLSEGQGSVHLSYSPTNTIVDFNNNQQADIFEANPTEFIISPIFTGLSGLGLNITTLIQIPDDPNFATQAGQANIAYKLRALANVYELHGARLTIQTEKSFMTGCELFDNVLLDLFQSGHDVHLFIDFPSSVISDQERELYILERRNQLDALNIKAGTKDGIAGGSEIDDFPNIFPDLGFDYASAYINPVTNEGLQGRTDVFRTSSPPDFTIPNPQGRLVYIPGDTDIEFQKNPMIVQSFIPITNSLLSAIAVARPDVINSWYFVLNINDYSVPETVLFNDWLQQTVSPLKQAGKVAWRTLSDTFTVFREYEKFLEVNHNRVRFITESYGVYGSVYGYGGIEEVKALKWDEVTNILTFTPVEKSGYYLFSYISGFTKYEEAEHLITCTWKLHTKDGQPPTIKMFLDGELVNHKVFGDL